MWSRHHDVVETEYRNALTTLSALHERLIVLQQISICSAEIDALTDRIAAHERQVEMLAHELQASDEPLRPRPSGTSAPTPSARGRISFTQRAAVTPKVTDR